MVRLEASVRQLPCSLSTVQHGCGTKYIGLNEYLRIPDTPVNMALCREMHHSVDVILCKNLLNRLSVGNVRPDKLVVHSVLNILEILQIARVCQHIHVDDTNIISVFLKHIVNIIAAYEACASGYEICMHILLSFYIILKSLTTHFVTGYQ